MGIIKNKLIDVSRLYTMKSYSDKFGINYNTVYSKSIRKTNGSLNLVAVNGIDLVFVTEEEEIALIALKKAKDSVNKLSK